ncbi:MAG TPA: alpha/beta hydrolase [Thermoanaerobaculia bacterium]|jgi:acetyl esterase/lipase|nr:alpha/beta hydrolase [Thermoanaerobaculia bacterium]
MDTRLQICASLLLIFLIVAPCLGEQPTAGAGPAAGALIPPARWQPAAGHTQIPLWPGGAPGARPTDGAEVTGYGSKQVAGRPWLYVDHVTQPTITVYSPQRGNSGAAVVVFPGGGYFVVAIDLEGVEACEWLTSRGITCVLLKYRVPCARVGLYRDCASALEDAQRAVGVVRARAAEWRIDPKKIGVLGFSAGGHMVAALSTHFEQRRYPAVDAADNVSCRPDFAIALYPGHLAVKEENFVLNPDIRVTSRTPPTFLLHATDDPVDPVENSLVYYAALQKAGVSAEMHLYAKGGHAFGLRPTPSPITAWPQLVEKWLKTIGVIEQ